MNIAFKVVGLLQERYTKGTSLALIQCYEDLDRTKLIKEFGSYVQAREFLGLKSIGDRLDNASENVTEYRGYYWNVTKLSEDVINKIELLAE